MYGVFVGCIRAVRGAGCTASAAWRLQACGVDNLQGNGTAEAELLEDGVLLHAGDDELGARVREQVRVHVEHLEHEKSSNIFQAGIS